jgi:hypothetical protein
MSTQLSDWHAFALWPVLQNMRPPKKVGNCHPEITSLSKDKAEWQINEPSAQFES